MKGFLRSLFGKSPVLSPEVTAARKNLAQLASDRPALALPATLLADVISCLFAEPVRDTPPTLTLERAQTKLAAGQPLLRAEDWSLDAAGMNRRWLQICAVVERQQPKAAALAAAVRAGTLDPRELLGHLVAGQPELFQARAEKLGLDPALASTITRWTAFPALAVFQAALGPLLQEAAWTHGSCPICGSGPLLSEYRGLEQDRHLRCGWCAADWPFPRLQCPFCENQDHRHLGVFHVEGEENRYRAGTCDVCQRSLKGIMVLTPLKPPALIVADLVTLHLDQVALERGYLVA